MLEDSIAFLPFFSNPKKPFLLKFNYIKIISSCYTLALVLFTKEAPHKGGALNYSLLFFFFHAKGVNSEANQVAPKSTHPFKAHAQKHFLMQSLGGMSVVA